MTFATSFRLSVTETDKWREHIVKYGDPRDIDEALRRYPGALGENDIDPGLVSMSMRLDACIRQIALENEDFSRSFLLRAVESRWAVDGLRRDIIGVSPGLVRPDKGFEEPVETILAALAGLTKTLPPKPRRNDFGDVRAFSALCLNRTAIEELERALGHIEAMKTLRDRLHFIQVEGGEWLDLLRPGNQPPEPPAPLIGLVFDAAKAIEALQDELPPALAALATGCSETCRHAAQRLQSNSTDEVAFALASLRSLLIRDLPEVSTRLFELSRDLPLRGFRALFAGIDKAIVAVVELGDTLRRRLMAQMLWQSADAGVYAIEQSIANPTPRLISDLTDQILMLRQVLRALLALQPQQVLFTAALHEALLDYDSQLGETGEIEALEDVPPSWRDALEELRGGVRQKFLNESQALRADLHHLVKLRAPLHAILRQVPGTCQLMLPT